MFFLHVGVGQRLVSCHTNLFLLLLLNPLLHYSLFFLYLHHFRFRLFFLQILLRLYISILLLLLRHLFLFFLPLMVQFQADVPRQAADGRHRLELVDHVTRDEIDVVVVEADAGVADALPTQLVEFGVVHPLNAL